MLFSVIDKTLMICLKPFYCQSGHVIRFFRWLYLLFEISAIWATNWDMKGKKAQINEWSSRGFLPKEIYSHHEGKNFDEYIKTFDRGNIYLQMDVVWCFSSPTDLQTHRFTGWQTYRLTNRLKDSLDDRLTDWLTDRSLTDSHN